MKSKSNNNSIRVAAMASISSIKLVTVMVIVMVMRLFQMVVIGEMVLLPLFSSKILLFWGDAVGAMHGHGFQQASVQRGGTWVVALV